LGFNRAEGGQRNESSQGGMTDSTIVSVERIEKEIHRLHTFFVDWFLGSVEKNDEIFVSGVENSMGDTFALINPQGILTRRLQLVEALKDAYGCRKNQIFIIECRNIQIMSVLPSSSGSSTVLCCYEEWQTVGTIETARMASAWFYDDPTNDQLIWLHVHETWLPGKAPPSVMGMWQPPTPTSTQDE